MKAGNFILSGALGIQGLTVSTHALQPEVLYEFQRGPSDTGARLVEGPDGYFYGTTWSGGSSGNGTVFRVGTGGDLATLASFSGTNGSFPFGAAIPAHADFVRSVGKEAGDLRIWAGIHFPMDNNAGVQLGRAVSQVFISWAKNDGSQ